MRVELRENYTNVISRRYVYILDSSKVSRCNNGIEKCKRPEAHELVSAKLKKTP